MIRNGFVSNSSSSSFIVVGKKEDCIAGMDNIINYIENNPDCNIIIFPQKDLSDGDNVFTPTKEQKEFLIKNKEEILEKFGWRDSMAVVDPLLYTEDRYENNIGEFIHVPLKESLQDVMIYTGEADYYSFKSDTPIDDFVEYFVYGY